MISKSVKVKADTLRREGHSYNYIAEKLKISKGTLSCWLCEIPYTPNKETLARIGKARIASNLAKHKIKLESFKQARGEAYKDRGEINNRDLFMLGVGLYIGEGSKTHDLVRVINANPKVIKLAIRWFKKIGGLTDSNFKIRLHLYPDNDTKKCIQHWSDETGLKSSQFHKVQIDLRQDKKMFKRGKVPYGTAHLSIVSNGEKRFGVYLARRINAWIDRVLE